MTRMKKNSVYIILLQGLLQGLYLALAIGGATARETVTRSQAVEENILKDEHGDQTKFNNTFKVNPVNQKHPEKLPLGKVWVVGQKEVKPESFTWVVNNTKKAAQQPFLELNKQQKKPAKKPSTTAKPASNPEIGRAVPSSF